MSSPRKWRKSSNTRLLVYVSIGILICAGFFLLGWMLNMILTKGSLILYWK